MAEFNVFDLDLDEDEKFDHLLSLKAKMCLERAGSHGIGITISEGEDIIPAGTLVFLPDMVQGDDEEEPVIELVWLYVDENYRNMGIGKRLMEIFAEIVNGAGASNVICDVPLDSSCDSIVTFLENWGFLFEPIEKNEFLLTWDDISEHHILGKMGNAPHVSSLNVLPKDALSEVLRKLQIKEWSALSIDELDPKLSGVYFDGNIPEGVFLIRRNPENVLEPLLIFIRENSKAYATVIRELLFHAINNMPIKFKENTRIYVLIRTLQGAKIWDGLFPYYQPAVVRRGVNILKEESYAKEKSADSEKL